MGTFRLEAGSASLSPCMLPGTQHALPCQHRLNWNLLNCKVTQIPPPPPALQHPPKAVTKMLPPCYRGVYCPSLPLSSRPKGYPPTPALSQLTPSTPSSGNCCVPAFSSHTVTVTQSHARLPAQHPPQDRQAHCNALNAVVSHGPGPGGIDKEEPPGASLHVVQAPAFPKDQLAEWPSGWEVAWSR